MAETQYYKLKQQTPADGLSHAVRNGNLSKIDAALHAKADTAALEALRTTVGKKADKTVTDSLARDVGMRCRVCAGYYSGDGEPIRYIDVGFPVQAALVERANGIRQVNASLPVLGGLATIQSDLSHTRALVEVSGNGFYVYSRFKEDGLMNDEREGYSYVAWG